MAEVSVVSQDSIDSRRLNRQWRAKQDPKKLQQETKRKKETKKGKKTKTKQRALNLFLMLMMMMCVAPGSRIIIKKEES